MGSLDDVLGSAVPQGSLAKPLMIALGALLASGALFKTPPLRRRVHRSHRLPSQVVTCLADWAGCSTSFSKVALAT